jgi:hypothetical protein
LALNGVDRANVRYVFYTIFLPFVPVPTYTCPGRPVGLGRAEEDDMMAAATSQWISYYQMATVIKDTTFIQSHISAYDGPEIDDGAYKRRYDTKHKFYSLISGTSKIDISFVFIDILLILFLILFLILRVRIR